MCLNIFKIFSDIVFANWHCDSIQAQTEVQCQGSCFSRPLFIYHWHVGQLDAGADLIEIGAIHPLPAVMSSTQ